MAGKIRKLIGVLLLITAFMVTQMPGYETSAASADFQIDKGTLVKYVGTASSVSIPASVKKIGAEAFAGNTSLTAVSIGSNVTEIEYGAFRDCTYLNKVILSEGVQTIGNGVFSNCSSLKKITLTQNVKKIGSGVFAGCEKLETIEVDEKNTYFVFSDKTLYNKDKTILYCYVSGSKSDKYTMPSTVEKIDEYAFWGNSSLKQITLSSGLKEISSYAFSNCKALKEISIPYAVKSIDSKAFENCINLGKVEIPASVSYIHSTAFDGCPILQIKATTGSAAYQFYENWKLQHQLTEDSVLQEGDTVVDETGKVYIVGSNGELIEADKYNNSSNSSSTTGSSLHDPSNVDYVPLNDPLEEAEEGVLGKTMIVGQSAVVFLDPKVQVMTGLENREISAEEESQSFVDDAKGSALPKFAIVGNKITANAYYGISELKKYSIPANIKTIGDFAFARSGLESIQIPNGVREIGYAAFYHCDALTNVSIPDSVTWIEPSAFTYTGWLTNWGNDTASDDFLIVGDNILLAYKGKKAYVEIPNGVETIAPACFMGHKELQGVKIPDSVTVIGEEAFMNCTSLQSVHGGENLVRIEDRAFKNTNLTEITIGEYVKNIGVAAFDCKDESKQRTVTFKGTILPSLSYTDNTSKIALSQPQGAVFTGNWTAILKNQNLNLEGTIFEDTGIGFTGNMAEAGSSKIFSTRHEKLVVGGNLTVDCSIPSWNSSDITVDMPYQGAYRLKIRSKDISAVTEGYQRVYGDKIPEMMVFDMSLYDASNSVSYTKFGNKPLTVTVPLPSNIKGNTVHVVACDEDGQLEKLSSSLVEKNGKHYVKFSTTHLSTFAIYAMGNGGTVQIENGEAVYTSVSGKKDYSPNTGDNSLHPKWFIALGMSALAVGLIIYKPKKYKYK